MNKPELKFMLRTFCGGPWDADSCEYFKTEKEALEYYLTYHYHGKACQHCEYELFELKGGCAYLTAEVEKLTTPAGEKVNV